MDYLKAIQIAASLCEDSIMDEGATLDTSEYLRGQCELIGDMYPREYVTLDERAAGIEEDIRMMARISARERGAV